MGKYKYVTDKDIGAAVNHFKQQGYQGDGLVEAAGQYADALEFKRFDQRSNKSRTATFAKSAVASTPGTVSSVLRGIGPTLRKHFKFAEQPTLENLKGTIEAKRAGTTFTPEPTDFSTSLGDRAFNFAADKIEGITPPLWQRQSQELAAGPKNPLKKGSGQAWAAMLGQQAPLMAGMVASGLLAKKLMPGVPTLSTKVGPINPAALLGGFEAMSSMETGGFIEATKGLGLDNDIQEKWASAHGPVSGAIEQFQMLGLLAPWKELGKSASTRLLLPLLKAAGKELSVAALEGLEETFQGRSFNSFLDKAVAEQNKRNQSKGLPDVDADHATALKQDLKEGFTAGFGISMIMRGGPTAHRAAKAVNQRVNPAARMREAVRQGRPDFVKEKGPVLEEAMRRNASPEELADMAVVEAPNIEPHGSVKAAKEAKVDLSPDQRREVLSTLTPDMQQALAKNYKVPLVKEDGTPKTRAELRQEVAEAVGAVDEGPRTDGADVRPILNKTPEAEVNKGNVLDKFLRKMVQVVADSDIDSWFPEYADAIELQRLGVKLGAPTKGAQLARNVIVGEMRWKALRAVVGDKIANRLLPLGGTMLSKAPELEGTLRRDQYAAYTSNLEGLMREKFRLIEGKKAENEAITGLFNQLPVSMSTALLTSPPVKIRSSDGTVQDYTEVAQGGEISWIRKFTAMLPTLESIESTTGLPLVAVDHALFEGRKKAQRLLGALKIAEKHIWSKAPAALRTGEASNRMSALVHWLLTDNVQKTRLARTVGISRNTAAFVKQVAEKTDMKPADILKAAERLKDDYRAYYDWFTQNKLIAPDMAHREYAPVIYKYVDDPNKGNMRLVEWIYERRKDQGELGQLLKGLSEGQIDDIADLADTVSSWDRKKYSAPGASPGTMEYARVADEAFMKELALEDDIRVTTDIYTRKAVQRMVFGHMVPAVSAVAAHANKLLVGDSRSRFNKIFGTYLESLMGVPDTGSRFLSKVGVPPTMTRAVVKTINAGINALNKTPLAEALNIETLDPEGKVSGRDVMDTAITYFYASSLGLPMNFTSPIKNLTQGLLVAGAVGTQRYVEGMMHMFKPGVMAEIKDMDLRMEFTDTSLSATAKTKWAESAKGMLYLYRMSDRVNVFSSAATALKGWSMINENMTDAEILGILFKGDKPKGLDDVEVMKPENSLKSNLWKGVISKPVSLTILDLIHDGKMDSAKRLYTQYLVNMSQWRYGAGGTPLFLRNSFMRAAFMFTSWSANYGDYMSRIHPLNPGKRPGMFGRFAQVSALQLLFASVLSGLGMSTFRWIWAGPFPDDFLPLGPAATVLESIWKVMRGTAVGITGELIPGTPQEDLDRNWTGVKRQLEDIWK